MPSVATWPRANGRLLLGMLPWLTFSAVADNPVPARTGRQDRDRAVSRALHVIDRAQVVTVLASPAEPLPVGRDDPLRAHRRAQSDDQRPAVQPPGHGTPGLRAARPTHPTAYPWDLPWVRPPLSGQGPGTARCCPHRDGAPFVRPHENAAGVEVGGIDRCPANRSQPAWSMQVISGQRRSTGCAGGDVI